MGQQKIGGFTLVEIAVAIVILAVAFSAASRGISSAVDTQLQLEQRTVAGWVAENLLAEHHALRLWPDPGNSSGQTKMGNDIYSWSSTVSSTPNPKFRRLDIAVSLGTRNVGQILATRTGFLTGPGSAQ